MPTLTATWDMTAVHRLDKLDTRGQLTFWRCGLVLGVIDPRRWLWVVLRENRGREAHAAGFDPEPNLSKA